MVRAGGKQILAEFRCRNTRLLNGKKLENILAQAAINNGFSVKTKLHEFTPYGITAVAILGESHIIIHTYPEHNRVSLDCYTCFGDPNKIVNEIVGKLKLIRLQIKEILRDESLIAMETPNTWKTDFCENGVFVKYHIKKNIFSKKTKYQQIDIIDNNYFGKMLFLDQSLQIAQRDAEVYNSALVTPAKNQMNEVLILGGGDGGAANSLLKYVSKKIVLVDIDSEVVQACQKFMPETWGQALKNPKVKIVIGDAFDYLKKGHKFDAIIYDLTAHPEWLLKIDQNIFFQKTFLNIKRSLKEGGIITMQCGSESDKKTLNSIRSAMKKYFYNIKFTKCFIPSYCINWVFASAQMFSNKIN